MSAPTNESLESYLKRNPSIWQIETLRRAEQRKQEFKSDLRVIVVILAVIVCLPVGMYFGCAL